MMRTSVALLLLLGVGVVAGLAPAVRAQDDASVAATFYDDGVDDIRSKAAAALWKAAESARKSGLHAYSDAAANEALRFDPEHKRARKQLGFVKKRGEWDIDPDAARRTERVNERPDRMSDEAFSEKQRRWRDGDLAAARAVVGKLYSELGKRCSQKGYAVESRRAFEEALRLDPDCEAARAALGFERFGEAWLTRAQRAAREAASTPESFEAESHLDEVLGVALTKVRSANVSAESVFGKARTVALVSTIETTYTYYMTDAGKDPNERILRAPVRACFVGTEQEWSLWLNDQVPARADFFRPLHFYRNAATLLLGVRDKAGSGSDAASAMEDSAVHAFVHMLNDTVWKMYRHAWLDEGLAYYYTLKVRGTTESWCVEANTSKYGGGGGDEADDKVSEAVWRSLVKQLVRSGDDMDLRMLSARKLNELKLSETIKGWSVATWLMETDRAGALRLFERMRVEGSCAEALEQHFGRPVEETDEAWRAWVLRTH